MRTILREEKIYNLEDIKNNIDGIKEKILNNMKEKYNDYEFLAEDYIQEKKLELEKLGYNNAKILYSGFWNQGDGACFTCENISFHDVYDRINEKIKHEAVKNLYSDNFSGYISHFGRYYHENSVSVSIDFSYSNYNRIDKELEKINDRIYDFICAEVKTISRKIYKELEQLYNHCTSEDYLLELIDVNEYEFDEIGDII